ncbi:hypothetical protein EB008_06420, partial [bacterium]|nr:hypothetical protein [bacterium]
IPDGLDFAQVKGLRNEARETLKRVQPIHLGQIGRLPGITPADLNILFVAIKGFRHQFALSKNRLEKEDLSFCQIKT